MLFWLLLDRLGLNCEEETISHDDALLMILQAAVDDGLAAVPPVPIEWMAETVADASDSLNRLIDG